MSQNLPWIPPDLDAGVAVLDFLRLLDIILIHFGMFPMLRSKGTRMDIRTYGHTDIGYPGVPRGPIPVPGFLIQKSVLPSKNQFFYPGNIFKKNLIFYKKCNLLINPHLLGDMLF